MFCNNIIFFMCDFKIILYFIGFCIEYCDMMMIFVGLLYVIVRFVFFGCVGIV